MARLSPQNEADIAEAVRAVRAGANFEIVAHGTKRALGRATETDAMLDVSALSGILAYEPDELVLTARAATPLAEIEAALRPRRQMLAFAPPDWGPLLGAAPRRATLAGLVAANASGARRVKAGAARDHVIGCRFVNGHGEAVKAGGRVVKNVTGFDLPKLMCGAFGTLGVLTELTLRVVPAPQRAPALALHNIPYTDGLALLRAAARLPLDATGLAYLPPPAAAHSPAAREAGLTDTQGLALIRVEGGSAAVADKLAALRVAFPDRDAIVLDDDAAAALFAEIGDGTFFTLEPGDVWRLSVPPVDAPAAIKAADATLWYADSAGATLWLSLPATRESEARLHGIAKAYGGHALLVRAPAQARARLAVFTPEAPARAALTRAVKTAFDPAQALNPGRMFEEV